MPAGMSVRQGAATGSSPLQGSTGSASSTGTDQKSLSLTPISLTPPVTTPPLLPSLGRGRQPSAPLGRDKGCPRSRRELPGSAERWESSGLRVEPFPFVLTEKRLGKGNLLPAQAGKGSAGPETRGNRGFCTSETLKIPFPGVFQRRRLNKPERTGALPAAGMRRGRKTGGKGSKSKIGPLLGCSCAFSSAQRVPPDAKNSLKPGVIQVSCERRLARKRETGKVRRFGTG